MTTASAEPLISTSMAGYLAEHPGLRYVFFGGKGGVGKTVMAAATAHQLAKSGRRTLITAEAWKEHLASLPDLETSAA